MNQHPYQVVYDAFIKIKNTPHARGVFSLILFFCCFFVIIKKIKIYEINSFICIEDKSGTKFIEPPISYVGRYWIKNKIKNKRPFLLEIFYSYLLYEEHEKLNGYYINKYD